MNMEEHLQKSLLLLNIEQNETNTLYFSIQNITIIQNRLRNNAKRYTGYNISNQSCSDILVCMQYFYVNYPQLTITNNVQNNVQQLDELVIKDLTVQIVTGIKQHLAYIKSIKNLPEPLEYGKSSNIKGQNSLEFQSTSLQSQSTNNVTDTNVDRYNEYQKMRLK